MARRVRWRARALRPPPVRSLKRLSSRPFRSASDMAPTRAAAISMASGMPSSLRQIAAMRAAAESSRRKVASWARARSANSWTAQTLPHPGRCRPLLGERERPEPVDPLPVDAKWLA